MNQPVDSPIGGSNFTLVANGLVALHRLIRHGRDDSPEADAIRDALDGPLSVLTETDKQRAQWLSEDLYSVSEAVPPVALPQMNPQAQERLNDAYEARQRGDWDQALSLLRQSTEQISPSLLSYLRGSIWSAAGHPDVAALFYQNACEQDPDNVNYRASYLHILPQSDPESAEKLAREVLDGDEKYAPVIMARAAEILFDGARAAMHLGSAQPCQELIPILEATLKKLGADEEFTSRASAYAAIAAYLAFCHEYLGHSPAAIDYYTQALQAEPNNDVILVARGTLLYGASPRAVTDFEAAVQRRCQLIWPYLFLAHHNLMARRFDDCRRMCEVGVSLPGSDAVKSRLEEWRAIAQAELGFPSELVRAAFDAALRLNPGNEQAKKNSAAYEAAASRSGGTSHSTWKTMSEMEVRQFGIAERRHSLAA